MLAARLIAELVKSSFGPLGSHKLLIDILGEVTLTKDGAAILRKIDVEHPAAKALIDGANSVDNEVGDGTITVVLLAGALLDKAEQMISSGIPVAAIIDGYGAGLEIALKRLEEIAHEAENSDEELMQRLVESCLGSKILSRSNIEIAKSIVEATKAVADFARNSVETDDIKIEEKPGNMDLTRVVAGVVIDKTIDNSAMPKSIDNAKILLIDQELEGRNTRSSSEITITRPDQLAAFKLQEKALIRSKVDHIIDSGANVVISRQGISAYAQELLAKAGIMSVKRVKENDLLWLAKATGANIATSLDHASSHAHHHHDHEHAHHHEHHDDQRYRHGDIDVKLGYAGRVYEKFIGDDRMVLVEDCKNPRAVTLLLRADSKRTLDECHRSANDAISVLKNFIVDPRIVTGAGSNEAAMAHSVRVAAKSMSGKEQIVLEKFAEALEEIPLALARNAGMNPIDTLVALRFAHSKRDGRDASCYGINVVDRKVSNMYSSIIEPVRVKLQVLSTAVEVACLLTRVDDVLMAKPALYTHTHDDGTQHSHKGGDKEHKHDYFDRLGKKQRPSHHYF